MKKREFRPVVDDAKLEDRLVLNHGMRFPAAFAFNAFAFNAFAFRAFTPVVPVTPVVGFGLANNVVAAVNLDYVGAAPVEQRQDPVADGSEHFLHGDPNRHHATWTRRRRRPASMPTPTPC